MVTIRQETSNDVAAIFAVHQKAFGGAQESRLVEMIRASETFIPELSLVADDDGIVVGHILFSQISITTDADPIPVLSLAPVGVLPDYQNRGIGSELIKHGLSTSVQMGNYIIIVIGHPAYYPRFGFACASEKGLRLPFDVPKEAFLVYEGVTGALDEISGTIAYPAFFADTM